MIKEKYERLVEKIKKFENAAKARVAKNTPAADPKNTNQNKSSLFEKIFGRITKVERRLAAEKQELVIIAMSAVTAGVILAINFFYVSTIPGQEIVFAILNILAGTILVVPPMFARYSRYKENKSVEERFPDFLRDVVEGIKGGMTLPLAIEYAGRNKYGGLTAHVQRLIAKISWGVPFEKSLEDFGAATKSRVIKRAVSTIIESHRSGGDIGEVLSSVGISTVEIDKIRKERVSKISAQMMSGYMIFFIFIGVMIGMQRFLLPALTFPMPEGGVVTGPQLDTKALGQIFTHLAVIQGVFAGLAIGKMSEGSLSAGIRHAVIMGLAGYAALAISVGI